MKKKGSWNPSRVLAAIGAIGYNPSSAILDICDNSVSANASTISVDINLVSKEIDGRKKAIINDFTIVDNGLGMDEDGIDNALSLGSSEEFYSANTLSKFGMGLKSAASSLGKQLTIISRKDKGELFKAVLDQDVIFKEGEYIYSLEQPSNKEKSIFNKQVGGVNKSGTCIIVSKIHHEKMQSIAEIEAQIISEAGVVYYYFIKGLVKGNRKLAFKVNNQKISHFDPLFEDSIDENGNLEEREWDGLSVKWITKLQHIQLDHLGECTAKVSITQLPHPPSVAYHKIMGQKECRDKYMIGAGNYGFYIYRNGRLISWADSLGMVGLDQDLYSFRGRLIIESNSDNILNIDVTKSRIQLSELAQEQLNPIVAEAKKKSIRAWNKAKGEITRLQQQNPHDSINEELNKIGELAEKDDSFDEEAASSSEKIKLKKRRQKAIKSTPITPEEKQKLKSEGKRVQFIGSLENNQLWERALDSELGLIAKVNISHRLFSEIVTSLPDNSQLTKILDTFFFALARGEFLTVYKSEFKQDLVEKILQEYRERVGNELSEIIRRLDVQDILT